MSDHRLCRNGPEAKRDTQCRGQMLPVGVQHGLKAHSVSGLKVESNDRFLSVTNKDTGIQSSSTITTQVRATVAYSIHGAELKRPLCRILDISLWMRAGCP